MSEQAAPPNFKSGKKKTIALIVAGVVGAGVIGAVVALALGGGDSDSGGSDDQPNAAEPGSHGSGLLDPSPVGNVSAAPEPGDGESTDPTEGPVPLDEPVTGGDTVTISGVQVFVPDGWSVQGDPSGDDVSLADEDGSWVYAVTGAVDPSSDAASVLTANLDTFLPSDYYSQLDTGDITPLDPFGSVVSGAVMDYEGLWVDTQGSTPVHGRIYAAIRQDGTALLIAVEHNPPDDFDGSIESWGQVVDQTYGLFGGS